MSGVPGDANRGSIDGSPAVVEKISQEILGHSDAESGAIRNLARGLAGRASERPPHAFAWMRQAAAEEESRRAPQKN